MRYESTAYGTLAEIRALIENSLNAGRSPRRREELRRALADLDAGETSVTFGQTTYIVDEEVRRT